MCTGGGAGLSQNSDLTLEIGDLSSGRFWNLACLHARSGAQYHDTKPLAQPPFWTCHWTVMLLADQPEWGYINSSAGTQKARTPHKPSDTKHSGAALILDSVVPTCALGRAGNARQQQEWEPLSMATPPARPTGPRCLVCPIESAVPRPPVTGWPLAPRISIKDVWAGERGPACGDQRPRPGVTVRLPLCVTDTRAGLPHTPPGGPGAGGQAHKDCVPCAGGCGCGTGTVTRWSLLET